MMPLGCAATAVADPAPERVAVGQGGLAHVRHLGPEDPAAEDDQGGRQHDQDEGGGDDDADGAGEPEAAGGREEREQQGEQAEDDGGGAREHGLDVRRRASAIASRRSRVAAQLVAVARDQQQRVVGARAEDEHREDADGRLVPDDVECRERVRRQHGGEPVGDADDDEREDPEDRAAVGQHEQQGDDGGGGDEQADVGARRRPRRGRPGWPPGR